MVIAQIVQAILFSIFATLTVLLNAILGPTYEGLLVPELSPSSLYPPLSVGGSGGFLDGASGLSIFVVVNLVDPAIPLVAIGIGIIYLARSALPGLAQRAHALLPRLLFAVVLANFSLPVASAILGLAGAGYPVLSGYDDGAWQHWNALAGTGFLKFSWDNGVLAFVLTFVLFSLVLLLAMAVALRDAMLAVLVVLLPLFTLVYPIPSLSGLARRGWILFGQLAFLPWVVIIPLELAVGSGSALLLVGYLTVALSAPGLLAIAGSQLTHLGFPPAGTSLSAGVQRGMASASSTVGAAMPTVGGRSIPSAASAVGTAARSATAAPFPATLPLFAGGLAGHATTRLFRHIPGIQELTGAPGRFPAVHPRGGGPPG
ncbi:MAG: hypothetical protein L3K08_01365 [Thermoplasmata archaeon]|nr:hypothetical protein [Thermoplasmata archaeon]